jgi:hypothetical protein
MAALLAKDTLLAGTDGLNIPIPVKYGERVSMQENQRTAIRER